MSIFHDDHADFDRPRKKSKPRTKDRPDYSKLPIGHVVGIDRGRYRCRIADKLVSAVRGRLVPRKGIIIGDYVRLDGDVSGFEGSLARVVAVEPRKSILRRSADDADTFERPIVANATQLMIVTALADPPPRVGMIDRILVAAYDAGISPILCLTKADLASPGSLRQAYEPLGIPIVVTSLDSDLDELNRLLQGETTVLIGHSGVGKSTLVNRLVPRAQRETGAVSALTGKGRHTSTSALAIEVSDQTWIVDTPGVRSFGISHVGPDNIVAAFPDLAEIVKDCPRGCSHASDAPECALDIANRSGKLSSTRLASFRRMERAFG